MSLFRTRIAPTPSGFLHTGNAFSFLLTAQIAKKNDGKILLRIDDNDSERKRPEYIRDIFDSLEWLGIEWEEGPKDSIDFGNSWSQQHRIPLYHEAIKKLVAKGNVFACACSRKQLQEAGAGGRYPGTCTHKKIPIGTPNTALRLHVPEGTKISFTDEHLGQQTIDLDEATGSFTILRRDGLPAYQLVSVVDDLHFGVNYIVRGSDLLSSTAAQLFLAEKLWNNEFWKTKFRHHVLLPDEHGQKLSKSGGALSLKQMRENGMTKEDILLRLRPLLDLERT